MKKKVFNVIFSIAFMAALLAPLMFVNLSGGMVSEGENRVLATRPPMSYAFEHPKDFIKQFDDWFSDNVGFRENFISLQSTANKLESHVRYNDGQYVMLIGEHGHHYFADVNGNLISKFQGKPFLADEQLSGMTNGLQNIKEYLDEKGIPLIVMFCADKETVYPEYYPKSIMRGPEPVQLDVITDYIIDHTGIDVFNIREHLTSMKKDYPVFDKTGDATNILSHYNELGAFFAYQELMKHISVYRPEMRPFSLNDVNITYVDKGERGVYKNIPHVALKETSAIRLDSDFFDHVELQRPFSWENMTYRNNDPTLPNLLILRDSYAGGGQNFLNGYLPEHFYDTIFIHFSNVSNLKEYVEVYNPAIVVIEAAERTLVAFSDFIRTSW